MIVKKEFNKKTNSLNGIQTEIHQFKRNANKGIPSAQTIIDGTAIDSDQNLCSPWQQTTPKSFLSLDSPSIFTQLSTFELRVEILLEHIKNYAYYVWMDEEKQDYQS